MIQFKHFATMDELNDWYQKQQYRYNNIINIETDNSGYRLWYVTR